MPLDKDNVIRIKKPFRAPLARVYGVFADDDFFDFCGADVESGTYDFRKEGAYSFKTDDDDFIEGTFKEIVPQERLVFTWATMGLDGPTGPTDVTVTFQGDDASCTVELVHTGLKHRKTAKGHDEAWIEILEAIAEDLAERGEEDD